MSMRFDSPTPIRSPQPSPPAPPSTQTAAGMLPEDKSVPERISNQDSRLPGGAGTFEDLVERVVDLAKILTLANGSAIAFRGEQGTIWRARSGELAPPIGTPVGTGPGISRDCLDFGTPQNCEDITNDARVDPNVSRALGIRSIAAVPIRRNGEVSGILEVFSAAPGVFTDKHLRELQQLANWIATENNGPNVRKLARNGEPDLKLLIELEPALRTFARNIRDLLSTRPRWQFFRQKQTTDWNHIFVESHLPWERFFESVLLHIVVIGMVSGLTRIWPRELLPLRPVLRDAHITYYPFSRSFPAVGSSSPQVKATRKQVLAKRKQPEQSVNAAKLEKGEGREQATVPAIPAVPEIATSRMRGAGLAASVVAPPPSIEAGAARRYNMPGHSVVAPPPDLYTGAGTRKMEGLRTSVIPPTPDLGAALHGRGSAGKIGSSGGSADVAVVPPPPSVDQHRSLTYGSRGIGSGSGAEAVAPAPAIEGGGASGMGRGVPWGNGGTSIVPPPPSIEGTGNSVGDGRGNANSLAGMGSQVVPPPPSTQGIGGTGEGGTGPGAGWGRAGTIASGTIAVGPAGSGSGQGGSGSYPGSGTGTSNGGGSGNGKSAGSGSGAGSGSSSSGSGSGGGGNGISREAVAKPEPPQTGAAQAQVQEVQLHVLGLTMALPRSSYFSNYEVYLAEKWVNKQTSELIKLVYVFLPYQRRLSEYGSDLKVHKLRVRRDPTCDESLMQMTWRDSQNGSAETANTKPANAKDLLPCYRTTADDYRRAISGGH